jgi:hypothetical protein
MLESFSKTLFLFEALRNWFANGMSENDVMNLAGHSKFETTHKFYISLKDDLIVRARAAAVQGVGQNLLQQ